MILLILIIPIVNIIMLFIWGFGGGVNKTKANYCKASLIWVAIGLILWFAVFSSIQLGEIVTENPREPELTGNCSFRLGEGLFTGGEDVIADLFRERHLELILYTDSVRHPEAVLTDSMIRDHSMWDVEQ